MTYSYDRRPKVASRSTMLRMIVEKALAGRSFESLVDAWNEEFFEDLEDEHEEVMPGEPREIDPWLRKHGFLPTRAEIEKRFAATYVAMYRRRTNASQAQALEVMDMPSRLLEIKSIAAEVVDSIATAQALADADDTLAMREMARQRQ